jgi:UDP-N-acetylglucosamine diphosphorylase/glucosamine-1-phosphate N-acetyltransferase
MNIILFDDERRNRLLPFTHTRPVADIRCGILSLRERWEKRLQSGTSTLTTNYLQAAFPLRFGNDNLYINGGIIADDAVASAVIQLKTGAALFQKDNLLAFRTAEKISGYTDLTTWAASAEKIQFDTFVLQLNQAWDIFTLNEQAIAIDFPLLTKNRKSAALPAYVTALYPENIFVEEDAIINPCILNASSGYIYIGREAELMEGCMVRGSFALGEHAVLKMGAKVYGATTIGPGCKVGGEVNNVVFFNNSNKGHDGFLGNAVIGDWCNLGADTNCSNLKNNYDAIKIWDEYQNKSVKTGLQFCGLLMGDHSKCGINTMFNTGTVVGVSCNIYGGDFPEKFIPSFSWGGKSGMTDYDLDKAIATANRMMERRKKALTETEISIFKYIFEQTQYQRNLLH